MTKIWYRPHVLSLLLLPLSALFYLLSSLRRLAYRRGWLAATKPPVPVIVVGNISVGGNGKTPLVLALCDYLQQQGLRPGVLSRGYGGHCSDYPLLVTQAHTAAEVGDEPSLMRQQVQCPVVIDPVRARGAQYLYEQGKVDVIITDDGLQHYALKRDIEIAVVDGERRLGNGRLLPAGPLREGSWRLQNVDFVVVNGGQAAPAEVPMTLTPEPLVNLLDPALRQPVTALGADVVAVAGIGHPPRFFQLLRQLGVSPAATQGFADHHHFSAADLPYEHVVMTAKDAVKCQGFARPNWWYLPVHAQLPESFKQQLWQRLQQVRRAYGTGS